MIVKQGNKFAIKSDKKPEAGKDAKGDSKKGDELANWAKSYLKKSRGK